MLQYKIIPYQYMRKFGGFYLTEKKPYVDISVLIVVEMLYIVKSM